VLTTNQGSQLATSISSSPICKYADCPRVSGGLSAMSMSLDLASWKGPHWRGDTVGLLRDQQDNVAILGIGHLRSILIDLNSLVSSAVAKKYVGVFLG
jgi:hypothetical protein